MKYRLKTGIVDAEPYKPGMEDAWVVVSEEDVVQFVTAHKTEANAWFDKYSHISECVLPAIASPRKWWPVREFDYIVTNEEGHRRVIRGPAFEQDYEPV